MKDFRVEVSGDRIEGFCKVPAWAYETSVVTLSIIKGKWKVASSTCMPTDIESAEIIQQCYAAVFEELERTTRK